MTTELTKVAQQALACMRGLQQHLGPDICAIEADALERALTTSQPAQAGEVDERVAFPDECVASGQSCQYGPYGQRGEKQCRYCGSPPSLPTQPAAQATPEPRLFIGACITDGRLHATVQRLESNGNVTLVATAEMDAASLHGRDCIAQMKQATPEPVGEPVAWRWMPSHVFPTWVYSDDQNRVDDARRFMGDGGVQALYTHPAPGVPEGFALVPVEPTPQMTTLVEHDMWDKPFVNGADVWSAVLAAAQAKGADPEDLAAAGVMLMGRRADHA